MLRRKVNPSKGEDGKEESLSCINPNVFNLRTFLTLKNEHALISHWTISLCSIKQLFSFTFFENTHKYLSGNNVC